MKGVLNVKGEDRRQVFHGVHMMFDAQPERPWGTRAARQQPGVHRPRPRSRRVRSRLRIRRRQVAMPMAKQSLSFALEPRASVAFDDYVADCAWSPDGESLAVAGGEGKVALARVDRRRALTLEVHRRTLVRHAGAWPGSRTRKTFATSGQDGADRALGWRGRQADQALETRADADAGAGVFARAAKCSPARPAKSVTLWSPEGEKIHAFAPAASTAVALAFDKPGTDLGVALNGESRVHRIEKSRYETRRYKWPAACLTVNFSGNGRFLASGMADGTPAFLESLHRQGFADAWL